MLKETACTMFLQHRSPHPCPPSHGVHPPSANMRSHPFGGGGHPWGGVGLPQDGGWYKEGRYKGGVKLGQGLFFARVGWDIWLTLPEPHHHQVLCPEGTSHNKQRTMSTLPVSKVVRKYFSPQTPPVTSLPPPPPT